MKLRLLVIFFMLATHGFSQKRVLLKFVVDHPSVDTSTGAYYGMQFEFVSERIYTSDIEFAEMGLFVKDSSQRAAIYFKHSGNSWYIRNFDSKWQLFYSNSKQRPAPTIKVNDKTFRISWKMDEVFAGQKAAVFMLKPQGFISNHQPDYLFDYLKGVVGLKTADITLIRSDLK